jgi:hypothetical protein
MNRGFWINAVLYALLGFLLSIGGISVVDKPVTFVAILVLVIVIENVGRWDEISRRYRG